MTPVLALLIDSLQTNPVWFFSVVFGVMLSIVLHELGHGFAAIWQGDDTPRVLGHITLDPVKHMGFVSIVVLFVVGIAWGQMPVNPSRFRSKYGDALVAFAGPFVNLLLALVALTGLGIWRATAGQAAEGAGLNVQNFLWVLGYMNIALALFNLLPLPPLDGATVLGNLVPSFRRFAQEPNNGPIFLGGFILVFMTAGQFLFPFAADAANTFLSLFPRA
ncbi:MAG: site-2 protease family protein [Planctomycetota bacterium]|nr:site-2 protease family protein [Planctomycetota bacterium]